MKIQSFFTHSAALVAASLLLSPASVHAAVWDGGTGIWNDANGVNWNTNVNPGVGENADINQSGITVTYEATPVAAPGLARLFVAHSGAGTTTFNLGGANILRADTDFFLGRFLTGAVEMNLSGTAEFILDGGGQTIIGQDSSSAVFNHTGGTFTAGVTQASIITINNNGVYNFSGGTINANRGLTIGAGGSYVQTNGAANFSAGNPTLISGNFNLSGGTFQTQQFEVNAGATASWTGGTMSNNQTRLLLNGAGASWTQKGGTLTVNNAGGSSGSQNSLFLVQSSTVQGYGTIQDARFGLSSPGFINNSGRIIADGDGVDRTLDLSRFGQTTATSTLITPTENTTNNGWYATNQGKLLLPTLSIAANASTNWGESQSDTTIDMVNSLRMTTSAGTTVGDLSISLLAPSRTDIAAQMTSLSLASGGASVISLWDFDPSTFAFGTGDMTITARFDRLAYDSIFDGMGTLNMYLYNGTSWAVVLDSTDMANNWMTSDALTSFGSGTNAGLLAITVIPEPSTWVLTMGGLVALMIFRRRRAIS